MRQSLILYATRLDLLKRQREATARTFASIDTFSQEGTVPGFDEFVRDKRGAESFEAFDQRIEFAFQKTWATHKAEIWNAHKREVREGMMQTGLTPQVLIDIDKRLDDRKKWLREVWAQIDSDYRSGDESRVSAAMNEIQQAHSKEGNEYIEWAYQTKYDMRFMGPKEKEDTMAKLKSANFPDISEAEVNRYMNRQISMNDLEETIAEKFGLAGRRHWDELQQAKDDEYRDKIDMAISIYEALQEKEVEAEEVNLRRAEKAFQSRKERAQLMLKKALDREDERKKIMEIDKAVEEKRTHEASEKRRVFLKRMFDMRSEGTNSREILNDFRRRSLADIQAKNNLQMQTDRSDLMEKKKRLFETMRQMQREANERSALESMTPEGKAVARKYQASEVGMEPSREDDRAIHDALKEKSSPLQRHEIWNMVHDKKYKTPAAVIHQARMDAHKTYSEVYRHTRAHNLRNIRKGDWSTGHSGFESRFYHAHWREGKISVWGMQGSDIQNLDPDGSTNYVVGQQGPVIENKVTRDAEKSRNAKHTQGPEFRGKRFYNYPASDTGRVV
ncbi:hypothetical protein XU18_1463 [Perkinsela sp. CCAP 1560/4]|nr:hypothetical protein XU18_3594 [Perkinsela sp. CCAP 1560/4]KNH07929.1 hypothetical protein XU18_1463 [Perkinsela sp. CCAP 1560/4]|eukprot:KNH05423.1 hypothetical protein XU18_3594 [Perkinsela sp. CCAP 1560/4]